MTVDTATLRAQYERFDTCTSGEQVGFLGCALADKVPELCDALDAERERVRVLTEYLSGFDVTEDGEVRDEDGEPYEDTFIVNIGMQAAGIKEIHAVLATAKGERHDA